eukprot:957794-Alexandrium_andersonii.AAC.1
MFEFEAWKRLALHIEKNYKIQTYRSSFWMARWGSKSAKPTKLFGTWAPLMQFQGRAGIKMKRPTERLATVTAKG